MSEKPASGNDIRMRGFRDRALVETALEWIDDRTEPLTGENVDYSAAHHRVLAADVTSPLDVPAFDRSAMDGFALRGAETEGAGDYNPLTLKVIGEALPGQPFDGQVSKGRAVRIMTGAPLPDGADAVLPAEYATQTDNSVEVTATVAPEKNVGRKGEDVTAGEVLLKSGRKLRPQDIGLLGSVGLTRVSAVRRPKVRLVVTGNELIKPGEPLGTYQIYESNSSMLRGLITRDGAELESQCDVVDDRDEIQKAIVSPGADVVLVSGGSSVGQEDHAPSILKEVGELAIHGIAMRPSSPTGIGCIGETLVCLLPGNPVSCLCAYDFFAGRAIRLMGGRSGDWPYARTTAVLAKKLVSAIGRVDYCRVAIENDSVRPLALSGASILSSTTRADGFVIVPHELEGYAPGTELEVYLYDSVN